MSGYDVFNFASLQTLSHALLIGHEYECLSGFFHGREYEILVRDFLEPRTFAEHGVLIWLTHHQCHISFLPLEDLVKCQQAIDVDENGIRQIDQNDIWILIVDFVQHLRLEVCYVDIVEATFQLNFHKSLLLTQYRCLNHFAAHLRFTCLLREFEEADEGANHQADGAILENADEPGNDEDPELKLIGLPKLGHQSLWHQTAGAGHQD